MLSPTEIADLFFEHDMHRNVTPVVRSVEQLLDAGHLRPQPLQQTQPWSQSLPDMGKLPTLSFPKYASLEDGFLAFLRDFNIVVDAYAALIAYRISQLRSSLGGDPKDLFESRTDMSSLRIWLQVQQAKRLFVFMDQKNAAWDFFTSTKYKTTDNIDLHFPCFVKHAKLAIGDDGEFMQQTAHTHVIHFFLLDLMTEARIQQFASDDIMLRHLKICSQFSKHD